MFTISRNFSLVIIIYRSRISSEYNFLNHDSQNWIYCWLTLVFPAENVFFATSQLYSISWLGKVVLNFSFKTCQETFIRDYYALLSNAVMAWLLCPRYDFKLIGYCPQNDVKLMWRHRGNDIVSVAAICAAAQLIFLFGRTRLAVASLRAGPVGCILYNL